jgi:Ca-activated chloride channel family protein
MFLNPLPLILLVLIPLFVLFFIWRSYKRASALRRIGDEQLLQTLLARISPARRRIKSGFWLLALTALILALARPTLGTETVTVRGEGVQLIMALDISRSMQVADIAPNRLERAKLDVRSLLDELPQNVDVGFILFARDAFQYMPLTYDKHVAQVFLEGASPEAATLQGTNLTDAINEALRMVDSAATDSPARFLWMLSDGENHEGDPLTAAQRASDTGMIIHTTGYGTVEGAQVPVYDVNGTLIEYKTYPDGTLVISQLDEAILQRIATQTGGIYQQAASSGADVQPILDSITAAQPGTPGERIISQPIEHFGWLIAMALLALSMDILLPETRSVN